MMGSEIDAEEAEPERGFDVEETRFDRALRELKGRFGARQPSVLSVVLSASPLSSAIVRVHLSKMRWKVMTAAHLEEALTYIRENEGKSNAFRTRVIFLDAFTHEPYHEIVGQIRMFKDYIECVALMQSAELCEAKGLKRIGRSLSLSVEETYQLGVDVVVETTPIHSVLRQLSDVVLTAQGSGSSDYVLAASSNHARIRTLLSDVTDRFFETEESETLEQSSREDATKDMEPCDSPIALKVNAIYRQQERKKPPDCIDTHPLFVLLQAKYEHVQKKLFATERELAQRNLQLLDNETKLVRTSEENTSLKADVVGLRDAYQVAVDRDFASERLDLLHANAHNASKIHSLECTVRMMKQKLEDVNNLLQERSNDVRVAETLRREEALQHRVEMQKILREKAIWDTYMEKVREAKYKTGESHTSPTAPDLAQIEAEMQIQLLLRRTQKYLWQLKAQQSVLEKGELRAMEVHDHDSCDPNKPDDTGTAKKRRDTLVVVDAVGHRRKSRSPVPPPDHKDTAPTCPPVVTVAAPPAASVYSDGASFSFGAPVRPRDPANGSSRSVPDLDSKVDGVAKAVELELQRLQQAVSTAGRTEQSKLREFLSLTDRALESHVAPLDEERQQALQERYDALTEDMNALLLQPVPPEPRERERACAKYLKYYDERALLKRKLTEVKDALTPANRKKREEAKCQLAAAEKRLEEMGDRFLQRGDYLSFAELRDQVTSLRRLLGRHAREMADEGKEKSGALSADAGGGEEGFVPVWLNDGTRDDTTELLMTLRSHVSDLHREQQALAMPRDAQAAPGVPRGNELGEAVARVASAVRLQVSNIADVVRKHVASQSAQEDALQQEIAEHGDYRLYNTAVDFSFLGKLSSPDGYYRLTPASVYEMYVAHHKQLQRLLRQVKERTPLSNVRVTDVVQLEKRFGADGGGSGTKGVQHSNVPFQMAADTALVGRFADYFAAETDALRRAARARFRGACCETPVSIDAESQTEYPLADSTRSPVCVQQAVEGTPDTSVSCPIEQPQEQHAALPVSSSTARDDASKNGRCVKNPARTAKGHRQLSSMVATLFGNPSPVALRTPQAHLSSVPLSPPTGPLTLSAAKSE